MVKAELEIKAPEKVDKNVGKALITAASSVKDISSSCPKVMNLCLNGICTLFAPLSAYLKGKSYEIACKYLPFQNQIEMRKEISQIKLMQYTMENLANKEKIGEELPPKIEDTDNLFAIQNAASETTDEEFISFWAKLYTEEACKPNTVSTRATNLCKNLNKNVVKILENDIFPYCDNSSAFFWGINTISVDSVATAEDYGFLSKKGIELSSKDLSRLYCLDFINYKAYIHAGCCFNANNPSFSLTGAGLEIKKCLKIATNDKQINEIIKDMEIASKRVWHPIDNNAIRLKYKKNITPKFLFVVTDKTGSIIYPKELSSLSVNDFLTQSLLEIERIN